VLDATWSDRLGGLGLRICADGGRPVTELSGRLPDQAALVGVLVSLYNLGLPLLSVVCRPATRRRDRPPEARVPAGHDVEVGVAAGESEDGSEGV
jgi:hypothetical protein